MFLNPKFTVHHFMVLISFCSLFFGYWGLSVCAINALVPCPTFKNKNHAQGIVHSRYVCPCRKSVKLQRGNRVTYMQQNLYFKDAATSLTLDTRLHAHQVGTNTRLHDLVLKQFLRSSDWLMHLELGYFARLISCLNDGATLTKSYRKPLLSQIRVDETIFLLLFYLPSSTVQGHLLQGLDWILNVDPLSVHPPSSRHVRSRMMIP